MISTTKSVFFSIIEGLKVDVEASDSFAIVGTEFVVTFTMTNTNVDDFTPNTEVEFDINSGSAFFVRVELSGPGVTLTVDSSNAHVNVDGLASGESATLKYFFEIPADEESDEGGIEIDYEYSEEGAKKRQVTTTSFFTFVADVVRVLDVRVEVSFFCCLFFSIFFC